MSGFDLEENFGLDLLFKLRGQQPPPSEVVVVNIDSATATRLGLPNKPENWPRDLHAQLIDQLSRAGAAVIVFDIFFKEPRAPAQDAALASAVRRAGNVILYAYLQRETVAFAPGLPGSNTLNIERLEPLAPALAGTAVAVAPFPLPKVPVRVSQFWTFRPSAGDLPTLPAVALQLYLMPAYADLLILLAKLNPAAAAQLPQTSQAALAGPGLSKLMLSLRRLLQEQPELGAQLLNEVQHSPALADRPVLQRQLTALIRMTGAQGQHFLNFYGPPGTVASVSYQDVLHGTAPLDLNGKVVFVGFSERLQPQQRDSFYTVFSQADGLDMAGIEIVATAFANLLEQKTIMPLPPGAFITLVIVYGILLAFICVLLPATAAVLGAVLLAAVHITLCSYLFGASGLWLPWVVPVLIQTPLAVPAALLWRYITTNRERKDIRRAFGYYLPDTAVEQLARNRGQVGGHTHELYGICLATDAEQYTRLAETLAPRALAEFMNTYYEVLFKPVRAHGGIVSDVIGDAMLALWSAPHSDAMLRTRACHAALDIIRAVEALRLASGNTVLPTRIGLHAGPILLGSVGAGDHYEYRAVGDIVNTANRIQALNKKLGTHVLASRNCLENLTCFTTRDLGSFCLPGKQQPVDVCELLCATEDTTEDITELCTAFAAGLAAFRAQAWDEARGRFAALLDPFPADGPARFYLKLCQSHAQVPPKLVDGIVYLD